MIKVLENVLSEKDWSELNEDLNSSSFPWFYQKVVSNTETTNIKTFYMTHGYVKLDEGINSVWADKHNKAICKFLTNYFQKDIDLYWSKANLFARYEENYLCGYHIDINNRPDLYTFVYYINTNNGGTQIENGPFIPSIKNTAVLMSGDTMHSSVVQTDTNVRLNMNFNFKLGD